MIRLLLIFLCVFAVAFISIFILYGGINIGMLWMANQMGFFTAKIAIDSVVLTFLAHTLLLPAIMFASITTGMFCIILLKAMRNKQPLRVSALVTIFKSQLLFTAIFIVLFYVVVLMVVTSGRTGLLLMLPYIKATGLYFDYGLPAMWLFLAWYWVVKYESKFINEVDEWTLN